jgi:putative membrane protein
MGMMSWGDGWWAVGGLVMVMCMILMGWMMMSHGGSRHGGRDHSEHGDHDDPQQDGSGPNAPEILAKRFARGEISEDEFEERRRVLERRPS